jgi:ABC-2 type transport system ATP-binding protein
MLKAINLTKSYAGKIALAGLSLEVLPGDFVCLLGGPGSGKSTAIDLFLGVRRPTSGVASIEGVSASQSMQKTRSAIAYVPTEFALYPELTAKENLEFLVGASGLDPLTDKQTGELMKECGIDEAAAATAGSALSEADRQKLGLAIGLAREARAFLLDDPTAKLGRHDAARIASLMRRLASGEVGGEPSAVLAATSDPAVAEGATRVVLLEKGRVKSTLDSTQMSAKEIAERCAAHV